MRTVVKTMIEVAVAVAAQIAHAQSCSMCYTTAAAAKAGAIQALKNGIVILLIPPILIAAGIGVLAYRNRNRFNDGSSDPTG